MNKELLIASESSKERKEKFIQVLKNLGLNFIPDVKFKSSIERNQITFKDENYFYKIYEEPLSIGLYKYHIRRKLAYIYENNYNIHWKLRYFEKDGLLYTLEERQILRVCGKEISMKDVLNNWKDTLNILEKELKLDDILKQIKQYSKKEEITYLKLLRSAFNKQEDYAYTDNGKIILLDDEDFVLMLADKDGSILGYRRLFIPVETDLGQLYFCSNQESTENVLTGIDDYVRGFFIYSADFGKKNLDLLLNSKLQMLQNNLNLYINKENTIIEDSVDILSKVYENNFITTDKVLKNIINIDKKLLTNSGEI